VDGSCCLETHLEHLTLNNCLEVTGLALELEVKGIVSCILLNHLECLEGELLARLGQSHRDKGS